MKPVEQNPRLATPGLATLATWLCLLALPLIYFFPAVTGQLILAPGDGWSQNLGVRVLIGQMLAAGQLPLWNPFIFAGTPLLASVYPGALYPPNWLFAIFSAQTAMNLVVITTYHIALIGTYLYARRIGISRVGAILAGMSFAFGGFMIAHLGHTSRIAAGAWLPWVLLAIEALYQEARWRWVALGAVCIALQLFAGEPQMNLYTIMVAGSYGLFSLLGRVERERRLRFLGAALAMALCGVLLSLIQLLPEREFLSYGERARITYEYFSQFSLPPRQILGLFFPYFFGGAALPPYVTIYWGEWNVGELASYTGVLVLALALVACLTWRLRRGMVVFWAAWAVLALVLSLGGNLPFELNRVLFHLPVYNLFRAPARNLLEFTFALGILAGWGVTVLPRLERAAALRACRISSVVLLAIYGFGVVLYRFFPQSLLSALPLPERAGALTNPEIWVPVLTLLLSLAALWFFATNRARSSSWQTISGGALIVVLLLDALSWGFFFEWRLNNFDTAKRLADPPAVQFVKQREADPNVIRILSHSPEPLKGAYDELDYPNVSVVRGLQSVNGYDALRLNRLSEIAGDMTLDGWVTDPRAFAPTHRGFDLLNVKYLFSENLLLGKEPKTIEYSGIKFSQKPLDLRFNGADQILLSGPAPATELALVTAMGNSNKLTNGTPILRLKLTTTDGRVIEREVQAGRDTSEWAYDRPDVKAEIQHDRAPLADTWTAADFQGHSYLARLPFDRAEITKIEIIHVPDTAELTIYQVTLFDAANNRSTPLSQYAVTPARWRKLNTFGSIEVYENLTALPRAWFARRAEVMPSRDVLQTIKSGQLPSGGAFNPAETVLFEKEDFGARPPTPPPMGDPTGAEVNITRYEPQRIELQTRNSQPGFLVLSEIYYRGWDAWVDGQRVPVERVNYVLRGLALAPGAHRVEFVFRAHSFRNGAVYSLLGALLLLAGAVISGTGMGGGWRRRINEQPWLRKLEDRASASTARFQQSVLGNPRGLLKRLPAHAELLAVALLGLCSLWYLYGLNLVGQPIRSDGVGYYLYLPNVLLRHTLDLDTVAREQFKPLERWLSIRPWPETGRYLNAYAPGESVLLTPFFLLGHAVALVTHAKPDGFSWPYQYAVALGGLVYVIAGLYLLKRALLSHFAPRVVWLTLLVITFATNLFHYAVCDNSFSHVYSFFLFCALLYLTPRWHAAPNWRHTMALAAVSGLIVLVRPTNGLLLLFVPLLGVTGWTALRERLNWLWQHKDKALGGSLIFLLTVAPLPLYWKLITGHWIVDPYGVPFYFAQPQLWNVLFSVRKGLFFWSPILLLAVAGFWLAGRYWKGFALPAALYLLTQLYLVASWEDWAFGGSFGHRAFTEALAIFAVGLASMFQYSLNLPALNKALLVISLLCTLLSVKLMLQYWNGILPYDRTTWAQFVTIFFKFSR